MTPAGLPHSEIPGSTVVCTSPRLIAAYHVLHRFPEPRHPPYALSCLTSISSSPRAQKAAQKSGRMTARRRRQPARAAGATGTLACFSSRGVGNLVSTNSLGAPCQRTIGSTPFRGPPCSGRHVWSCQLARLQLPAPYRPLSPASSAVHPTRLATMASGRPVLPRAAAHACASRTPDTCPGGCALTWWRIPGSNR